MFAWVLVDSCYVTITVDSSISVDRTSVAIGQQPDYLQSFEYRVTTKCSCIAGTMLQSSDDCIQINIMPGDSIISSTLRITRNLALSSAITNSSVQVSFQISRSIESLYVLLIHDVEYVTILTAFIS